MTDTYSSPLLASNGAVAAGAPDEGVAAHYGEPLPEQRRLLRDRSGFVDLSHRGVVRVSGPDRLSWLHSLTTQALDGLRAGESTTALLLSPQGRIEHAMYLVEDGEAVWAHVEPGVAAGLTAFLESMRFMLRVEPVDLTTEYAVVWEPAAGDRAVTSPYVASPYLVRQGTDSLDGRELFVPRSELTSYAETAGAPAGVWAYEAFRVAAAVPRFGRETDHKAIPNELGWLDSAVHLDKGCYRGQETVARVHNLGKPPRRLTFLHLDGSVDRLPEHGTPVRSGDREVGFVTTAVRHVELGPIGLALLKRNTPVDAPLTADGVAAAQEVVVPPEIGLHVRAGR